MKIKVKHVTKCYFSESEKHAIIKEFISTDRPKQEIWKKYTGQDREYGRIVEWMRTLGYDSGLANRNPNIASNHKLMSQKKSSDILQSDDFASLQLKKRITELEKQLKDAELKAIAFSTMVDIAEKEFNIPIRKKYNTKP